MDQILISSDPRQHFVRDGPRGIRRAIEEQGKELWRLTQREPAAEERDCFCCNQSMEQPWRCMLGLLHHPLLDGELVRFDARRRRGEHCCIRTIHLEGFVAGALLVFT